MPRVCLQYVTVQWCRMCRISCQSLLPVTMALGWSMVPLPRRRLPRIACLLVRLIPGVVLRICTELLLSVHVSCTSCRCVTDITIQGQQLVPDLPARSQHKQRHLHSHDCRRAEGTVAYAVLAAMQHSTLHWPCKCRVWCWQPCCLAHEFRLSTRPITFAECRAVGRMGSRTLSCKPALGRQWLRWSAQQPRRRCR